MRNSYDATLKVHPDFMHTICHLHIFFFSMHITNIKQQINSSVPRVPWTFDSYYSDTRFKFLFIACCCIFFISFLRYPSFLEILQFSKLSHNLKHAVSYKQPLLSFFLYGWLKMAKKNIVKMCWFQIFYA